MPNDENANDKITTDNDESLASDIDPPPKKLLEIEGVGRVDNETEERKTEGVDSDNEGFYKKVLPPEQKGYSIRNPRNTNYINKRVTRWSMGWKILIVVSNELHSVVKSYSNVVNAISTFVEPTPPTNIIKNDTILNQYV